MQRSDCGRYEEAMSLFEEALDITQRVFGARHMDVATSLTNIAGS